MFKKWMPSLMLAVAVTANAGQVTEKPFDKSWLRSTTGISTFAIIGDYGNDSKDEKRVAKLVDKRNPDYILTLGDNNYSKGCWKTIDKNIGQYYSRFIGNYKGQYGPGALSNRFYPSLGNHDWRAIEECRYKGDLPYLSYFTLPNNGRYYDFVKGDIHFYALDSDRHESDGNKKGSKQYQWLKQKLKESTSCFNVVFFHHPPYSSGEHGNNKDMNWKFDDLGIDVVLAGHDHNYERIERDGIYYIVNGAGGAKLRNVDDEVKGSKLRYAKKHGYMMGYGHGNKMGFAFFNEDDELIDGFDLEKNCH